MEKEQMIKQFFEHFSRSSDEYSACATFVQKNWPKEVEHILRIAEEVKNKTFLFDLPWDMEQTKEPIHFKPEIIWDFQPKDDPEFIYQMNRHRYWICLGQAYILTKKEVYAECLKEQMLHWISHSPLTEQTRNTTWRTLEMGLRGIYWPKAMAYLKGSSSVDEEMMEHFLEALMKHGDFLYQWDVPFSKKSNWGVLENAGLYVIGKVFDGTQKGKKFQKKALRCLKEQLYIQVMEDGMHWEQSIMYHNEVLMCYLEVLRTAKLFKEEILSSEMPLLRQMAMVDRLIKKPDGKQPMHGDSDDTGLLDVLTACAHVFSDPVLKSGGYPILDYESVWDYGMEAETLYETLPSKEPETLYYSFKESGHLFLRSGWDRGSDYLHFINGSLGGGHGHMDKLHIDLSISGEDILLDSGRYTYMNSPIRRQLKSASAHNTITVDGMEYAECIGSWEVMKPPLSTPNKLIQKGIYTYMEGGHLGYLKQGIYVMRRILCIGTKFYLIQDVIVASGSHFATQHFHFPETKKVEIKENQFTYVGNIGKASFFSFSSEEGAEIKKEKGYLSRHYNAIDENETVQVRAQGQDGFSITTAIFWNQKGAKSPISIRRCAVLNPSSGKRLTLKEAEGFVIEREGKRELVIFSHMDAGSYGEYIGAEGKYGLGRVMAVSLLEPDKEMTMLCW